MIPLTAVLPNRQVFLPDPVHAATFHQLQFTTPKDHAAVTKDIPALEMY